MIISDLNHLEVVEGNSIVGGIANKFAKTYLEFKEIVDIEKKIVSKPDIKGNVAFGEADAVAEGKNTLTQFITESYAIEGKGSGGTATSVAVAL
jgi:hypothetical protein